MREFTSTEIAKRFGEITKLVQSEPISVLRHGRPVVVMLSPDEYKRLRRLDRRVYSADCLPDELVTAIGSARARPESVKYDSEVRDE